MLDLMAWITSSSFDPPANYEAAIALTESSRLFLNNVVDGTLFSVAGRDYQNDATSVDGRDAANNDSSSLLGSLPKLHLYTPWTFGIGLKHRRRIMLMFPTCTENWLIDGVDFVNLVRLLPQSESKIDEQHQHQLPQPQPMFSTIDLSSKQVTQVGSKSAEDAAQKLLLSQANPACAVPLRRKRTLVVLAHGFSPESGPDYPFIAVTIPLLNRALPSHAPLASVTTRS
jgi:hypothetical protein